MVLVPNQSVRTAQLRKSGITGGHKYVCTELGSMDTYQAYIIISVLVFAIIALLLYLTNRGKPKGLSKLAALSFAFIIAGIVFGEDRRIGYTLLGVGILLAVADIYSRLASK